MALTDWFSNVSILVRWLHVIAGITWIGHLYFFNFVNVPLQGALDDAAKKAVNPKLMPRALWWFRWGAMITFLAGLVLFTLTYMYTPGQGFGSNSTFINEAGNLTSRAIWILFALGSKISLQPIVPFFPVVAANLEYCQRCIKACIGLEISPPNVFVN